MSAEIEPHVTPSRRVASHWGWLGAVLFTIAACGPSPQPTPTRTDNAGPRASSPDAGTRASKPGFAPPDLDLLRFACAGFDRAVADAAPPDRLLSHAAARAVELGGAPVEAATRRWALLPPQALLEEIQQYTAGSEAGPDECAGLRAHLERMAIQSGSH
ncbi:hypothetical protein [Enhygromyxa salina]|uniref:Uncharacterized protein n=1 Tax=Enhygromyxa salina TaxID=215803 RepID=A0A2S9YWT1_9BACT|nr:hypothetical protein [Enhygromyxa salina]PRQ09565.1 hypothetical protein ENSA7_06200 [Enhygromyxa salina]